MKKLLTIPALVAALALTACGDDTGKRFADGMNHEQNEAAEAINAKVATGSTAEIRKVAAAEFGEAADDILKLKAPEGVTDERDALIRTLRQASNVLASDKKINPAYLDGIARQVAEQTKDLNRAF